MKRHLWTFGLLVSASAVVAIAQPPGGPGGEGGRPNPGGRPPSPVIEALDADKDGVISAEELKKAGESLSALDKNKDGKLTEDEFRPQGFGRPGGGAPGEGRPAGGPPGEGRPGAGQRPGGGQGMTINPERMLTHAFEFDADKDGKLSKEELQKFIEDFVKRHSGGGAGGPGAGGPGGGRPQGGPPGAAPGGGRPNTPPSGDAPERPRRPE